MIGGSEAVEDIILMLDQLVPEPRNKQPFMATLKAAAASFERGSCVAGVNQLEAFQSKVRAQLMKTDPEVAQKLIQAAQLVIDTFKPCACWTPRK